MSTIHGARAHTLGESSKKKKSTKRDHHYCQKPDECDSLTVNEYGIRDSIYVDARSVIIAF